MDFQPAVPERRVFRRKNHRFPRSGGVADGGQRRGKSGCFPAEFADGSQRGGDPSGGEISGRRRRTPEDRFKIGDGVGHLPRADFDREGAADRLFEVVRLVDHAVFKEPPEDLVPVEKGQLVVVGDDEAGVLGLGGDHLRRTAEVSPVAAAPGRDFMLQTAEEEAVVQVKTDPLAD